jgi:anti-sigma B factor antagonist
VTQFGQYDAPDGTRVVEASGEIDLAAADRFRDATLGALADAPGLEINLRDVTFMDSTGLGVLVRVHKEATAAGKGLWISDVPSVVTRLLEITGLTETFPVRERSAGGPDDELDAADRG